MMRRSALAACMAVFLLRPICFSDATAAQDAHDFAQTHQLLFVDSYAGADKAIEHLEAYEAERLIPELTAFVDAGAQPMAWTALRRLSRVHVDDTELQSILIETLIKQLDHPDHAYRSLAAQSLINQGESIADRLTMELDSPSGATRASAAHILLAHGRLDANQAIKLTQDSDARVRYVAIQGLDHNSESADAMLRLITDQETAVAYHTALSLYDLGFGVTEFPQLMEALISALERPVVGPAAAIALARNGSDAAKALPAIIRSAPESRFRNTPEVSPEIAIKHIGAPLPSDVDQLLELFASNENNCRGYALQALQLLETDAEKAVPLIWNRMEEIQQSLLSSSESKNQEEEKLTLRFELDHLARALFTIERSERTKDLILKLCDSEMIQSHSVSFFKRQIGLESNNNEESIESPDSDESKEDDSEAVDDIIITDPKAIAKVLSDESLSVKEKCRWIQRHQAYNDRAFRFLAKHIQSEEYWDRVASAEAIGAAGLQARRFLPSLRSLIHVIYEDDDPFKDELDDLEIAAWVAIYKITGEERFIDLLINRCKSLERLPYDYLSDVFDSDIPLDRWKVEVLEAHRGAIHEFVKHLSDFPEVELEPYCDFVMAADPVQGRMQIEAMTNHTDAMVRKVGREYLQTARSMK